MPEPFDTIRERLSRCKTRADVLKVGDAFGKIAGRLDPEIRQEARDMIAKAYDMAGVLADE